LEQLSQYLTAHGVGGAAKPDRTVAPLVDKCRGVLGTLAQLLKVPLDTVVTEYDGGIRRRAPWREHLADGDAGGAAQVA